jgi:putative RecB family exonuclease
VVVDYKTGRAPSPAYEQAKLVGVHLYALLCEEVLGRRPAQVRLLHLKEPTVITAEPTEQALRGHRIKTTAVWSAIERACRDEDFRPRTSPLCDYCRFRAFCPAYGGDPAQAAVVLGAPVEGAA